MKWQPRQFGILGVLVAVTAVVDLSWYLPFCGVWPYPSLFFSCALMAILPLLLANIVPKYAGFNKQWLPLAKSHWVWFVGMVVLLFGCVAIIISLATFLPLKGTPPLLPLCFYPEFTFTAVILQGIVVVLLCPIAEEIFYRGYLLEQLRRLTHTSIALLIQAALFGLTHLPIIGPRPGGFYNSISAFLFGVIFGVWRIRFRSIVPLILAHMIINSVAYVPELKNMYHAADIAKDLPPDWVAQFRSNLKYQQIYRLTKEPVEKAVPGIIGYFADADWHIRLFAGQVLRKYYQADAEPYLKEVLASKDKDAIDTALFMIDICHYSDLQSEIRTIAWSFDDVKTQISAMMSLRIMKDLEGIESIAETHPNEKVRGCAERMLQSMKEEKSAKMQNEEETH